MNPSHSTTRREPRRAWRRAGAAAWLALAALAFTACGGGGSAGEAGADAATPPPVAGSALECERLAYPCTWAQVDRSLVERSDELARALRERLDAGMPTAEAVAWLRTQATLAEVQFDADKVRFRLPGSRAAWAARAGSMSQTLPPQAVAKTAPSAQTAPAPSVAGARRAAASAARLAPTMKDGAEVRLQSVIRPGAAKRSALVLAPAAHEHQYLSADRIAEILDAMPDYSGNVTLLQNLTTQEVNVTVDSFRDWNDHDVIFVVSHGGELCWDPDTGASYRTCKGAIRAQRSTHPVIDAIESTNVGVELLRYQDHANLLVTEDFFRHHYPQGLNNKLVYIVACYSWNPGLVSAIQGSTGVYVGWEDQVVSSHGQWVAERTFEWLAAGVDIKEAMAMLGDQIASPGGALLHASDRRMRIRDLITVHDAYTSLKLTDDSGIEVGMRPGDGQPDHALLEVTIDGIRPENADAYVLDVLLDSKGLMSVPVGARAQHLGNFRWKLPLELPLGIDAQPGQRLPLQFAMRLPGSGHTFTLANPKVNEAATMPLEWAMKSTTVQTGPVATIVKTADLVWEAEPDTRPEARYRYFRVKSGTLVYSYSGDFNNCKVQFTETVEIPPGATNHELKFDMAGNPPLFTGFARASNRAVNVQGTCADGSTLPYSTTVGGVYLYAKDLAMNGTAAFGGSWTDGANTQVSFEFTKRR